MTNNPDGKFAICVPERGNWAGGDNVLMVLTELDRKNGIFYSLLFIQHLFWFCCSIPCIFRFFRVKSENKYSVRTGRYEDDYL